MLECNKGSSSSAVLLHCKFTMLVTFDTSGIVSFAGLEWHTKGFCCTHELWYNLVLTTLRLYCNINVAVFAGSTEDMCHKLNY